MSAYLRNPLIIALDVDSESQALSLADELSNLAGAFKIGPRLLYRYGKNFSLEISKRAPLFVDCKFFDIPSTMEAAVQASFDSGATLVTVHALAGTEALRRLYQLEKKLNHIRPFKILCVTILTSWDSSSFSPVFKSQIPLENVLQLTKDVLSSQLTGIVCSPEEITPLKVQFHSNEIFLVTPGIRLQNNEKNDQKRTLTPREAIQKGSSGLVVGRPIIESADPRAAAQEYLNFIQSDFL